MDAYLQRLFREYTGTPTNELAHKIVNTLLRTGEVQPPEHAILPFCAYGYFLLDILANHEHTEVRFIETEPAISDNCAVLIAFQAKISRNCTAIFESEQSANVLWPMSNQEDIESSRQAFFVINLRDEARDIVYTYHVNDNTITVDNELGQTGWGTQSNFVEYLQGIGFECDVNYQQNMVAATLALGELNPPIGPMEWSNMQGGLLQDGTAAMETFQTVLLHLNMIGPNAY